MLYGKGSQTFQPMTPKNNNAWQWGPPSTLEVAYDSVHTSMHTV